jgi:hypothetical protein
VSRDNPRQIKLWLLLLEFDHNTKVPPLWQSSLNLEVANSHLENARMAKQAKAGEHENFKFSNRSRSSAKHQDQLAFDAGHKSSQHFDVIYRVFLTSQWS